MTGPGAAVPRYVRGGFLAAACTLLALGGHVWGGARDCCLPPLPAVLVTGGAVGALSVAVTRRTTSFWKILAVIGWAQVAFHMAFTVTAGSASAAAHHPSAVPEPAATGPSMLAGHAVAAVAGAALLAGADRALWWLCGAIFAIVVARLVARPVAVERPAWVVVAPGDRPPPAGVVLARAVRRRGPPVIGPHAA
ncbi:hypothetical protein [Actinomadura miaoliensis]|uniref:hypothetical protein n=1 Tax=Actinomadura miaoliensis TaxID=430685 RepID=UPI0031E6DDCE